MMDTPDRRLLYSYESGQLIRELSDDEWRTYQALLDSYTPAAKEHGVVEGVIFGLSGLVYARVEGEDDPVQVLTGMSHATFERLRGLADANGLSMSQVVEQLVMRHPRWAPIDPNAPFEPADHLEILP
ncbi:hypothetical protein D3C72_1030420 [compost metagenome]